MSKELQIEQAITEIKTVIRERTPHNPILHGWKSYSQTDEDGIIEYCLKRIGNVSAESKTFVEIGCGNGTENNSHLLLLKGYRGVWIDGSKSNIDFIATNIGGRSFDDLLVIEQLISPSEDELPKRCKGFLGTDSLDFLSIDIDGYDEEIAPTFIQTLNPKLICVEYNAKFRPPIALKLTPENNHQWGGDDYYGSSLQSWVEMMSNLGFTLVSCNISGVNAFFIKNELLHCLEEIYDTESLYMPARYWTAEGNNHGHRASLKWLKQRLARRDQGTSNHTLIKTRLFQLFCLKEDYLTNELKRNRHYHEHNIRLTTEHLVEKWGFSPENFLNIGANIGLYSIYALKSKLYQTCIAIEPSPINFELLQKNISLNNLSPYFSAINAAVSDFDGDAELELCSRNCGDHRVRDPRIPKNAKEVDNESKRRTARTTVFKLDSLTDRYAHTLSPNKTLAWIDTQGHEGHVLKGGTKTLHKECHRFAVVEFWPYGLQRTKEGPELFYEAIDQCEKVLLMRTTSHQDFFEQVSLEDIKRLYEVNLNSTRQGYYPHNDLLLVF
ncbi:FkbM family methyltransferase [Synechococcus sp. NB0720_010]|uniref:FkbM family methyltransferase n=1 Tax=Synechococcus sp. NB0720_010 TaxID=2907159 RepID=UPI001FF8139F|nr:FkbM family methyltransferase [Synechococcus sp. NB0720_010]UPH89528.1 FkbM family methyltransferase [Synechococcus sp. NB0720_010]